jgi:hypothetical protein
VWQVAAPPGFFAGALLGSIIAFMFFSVGLAYYIVLFMTLYQRLPMNKKWEKQYYRMTAGQQLRMALASCDLSDSSSTC